MLLVGYMGFSQATIPPIPAVSVNELLENVHPQDSSAAAAYLYYTGKTHYELKNTYLWSQVTEVYVRVKIYKKEGLEKANASIAYYSGSNTGKGVFLEANTYNLVNGVIEKTALKSDGEFIEHLHKDFTLKKITLPNVKQGSIIEYRYQITTPDFLNLQNWHFQYDIPVKNMRYDVYVPLAFTYNTYVTGYTDVDIGPQKLIFNKQNDMVDKYNCYTAQNVKAFRNEEYVNNIDNYISTLKHELTSLQFLTNTKQFSLDWETVVKKIFENDDFGWELRRTSYFNNEIAPLIKPLTTDKEKANAIFSFVKNRMAWNEQEGYYCNDGVKKAYDTGGGNAAEINLMLVAMLRYAKLDANPVLVSTRDNGIAVFPTYKAYNYVIAAAEIEGKTVLMDATSKFAEPDILPLRDLNWQGRLIKKDGTGKAIDLMPKATNKELISVLATISPDGTVQGKTRSQYVNHGAYVMREVFAKAGQADYLEMLEGQFKGIAINDYKMSNAQDTENPLVEEYTFTNSLIADVMGEKIYFNPMLYFSIAQTFKQETREYPVDFTFPRQNKFLITITIPKGYVIESLPKTMDITMENKIGAFKYNIVLSGNNIQLAATLEIFNHTVMPEHYQTLKEFFKIIIAKQNEKIVLKKA
ncbi:transglutaminase [Flavobacterium subsaxonicum WB 4.1-42 = DSM 21790]|uniref:Transglutaminase n=2 Tax=Flavobacterium TaxID=237 RepID=A0A0A2MRL7_9FLAO|nr:transglutaminase [Flavobacterium subsaxonicum WB 4.1-42 = DSM 21790]